VAAVNEQRPDLEKLDEAGLRALVSQLFTRIDGLERMLFARKSEKARYLDPTGLLPFPEFAQLRDQVQAAEQKAETVTVPAHTRTKSQRRSEFPEHLPRHTTECTLDESQRKCPACGDQRGAIGNVETKELERLELCYVHVIQRRKYACSKCRGYVITAPGPDRVLDRCIMGPNFLAQVIFDHFANHMPYARLEKKYAAEGLDLSRSVLNSSTMRCADLLAPVCKAHKEEVLQSLTDGVLQSDDTEAIQRHGNDKGQDKVHVWAWRDQDGGVFFDITPSRNQATVEQVLAARSGRLQCDGHDCFNRPGAAIVRIGCWAHARRKFKDALLGGDELARPAMEWTRQIFAIERQAREAGIRDPDTLRALRQEKTRPILNDLKRWVDLKLLEQAGLPRSPLMDAVGYASNQWPTLTRFVEDGHIRDITNNGVERSLRSVVIGRRNWLWFGSEDGARRSAVLMSLVQSCKELGINPLLYLREVLRAVATTPASEVRRLTPRGWKLAHGSTAPASAAFLPFS
jgi:transposase